MRLFPQAFCFSFASIAIAKYQLLVEFSLLQEISVSPVGPASDEVSPALPGFLVFCSFTFSFFFFSLVDKEFPIL